MTVPILKYLEVSGDARLASGPLESASTTQFDRRHYLPERRRVVSEVMLPMEVVRLLNDFPDGDFVREIIRIKWVDSSLGYFRLRVHEVDQGL